jgi:hypothetical protein
MPLRTHAGFRLFWTASTVSDFGTPITTLAIQVLVVTTLSGSAAEVGLVNAARWLPYLLFGALADRARRKPLLVGTDLGRAVLLCAVPLLAWPGLLSLPTLAALVAAFGRSAPRWAGRSASRRPVSRCSPARSVPCGDHCT